MIGPIYTRDGSSVWDELGQRTIARLIIRLCINTGKQTDKPSWRVINGLSQQLMWTEWSDSYWRRILRLGRAWAKNGSSFDKPSVYKYGQADGSTVLTGYQRVIAMVRLKRRTIPIARVDGWSVSLPVFTTSFQAREKSLGTRLLYLYANRLLDQSSLRSLSKFVPDGWSVSSINRAIRYTLITCCALKIRTFYFGLFIFGNFLPRNSRKLQEIPGNNRQSS